MAGLPRRHVDQHDTAHLTRGPEWAIPKRAVPAWAHVVPCQATHLATTTFGLWMLGHTCELFAKISLLRDQIEKIASRERIGKKQYPEHVGRRHMSPAMLSPHGITTTVLICVSIVRTRQKNSTLQLVRVLATRTQQKCATRLLVVRSSHRRAQKIMMLRCMNIVLQCTSIIASVHESC